MYTSFIQKITPYGCLSEIEKKSDILGHLARNVIMYSHPRKVQKIPCVSSTNCFSFLRKRIKKKTNFEHQSFLYYYHYVWLCGVYKGCISKSIMFNWWNNHLHIQSCKVFPSTAIIISYYIIIIHNHYTIMCVYTDEVREILVFLYDHDHQHIPDRTYHKNIEEKNKLVVRSWGRMLPIIIH